MKRARTAKGSTGFYRAYNPGTQASLEDAVAETFRKAEELGFTGLRLNRHQSGKMENGGYFVALTAAA